MAIKKANSTESWKCCDYQFSTLSDIGKHVNQEHAAEIQESEVEELDKLEKLNSKQDSINLLKQRRGEKGTSDPILFNANVTRKHQNLVKDPVQLALDHQHYCSNLLGKVRIAGEGLNVTLAGTNEDIDTYLNWITSTQPFDELEHLKENIPLTLSNRTTARYQFFKPSPGCKHVFSELSLKLVEEICPLGQQTVVLDKLSKPNHRQGKLSPQDFHAILSKRHDEDFVLLDTRNYYESKIGHFEGAVKPAIRKFSQFPAYIDRNKQGLSGKKVLTYCTGGIRCEKATAYMRQALPDDTEIYMLDGGIHNYLEWCKNVNEKDPIWQGKNYVFDARQSLGLDEKSVVSTCQQCSRPWDKYKKCSTAGCHLLVLSCTECSSVDDKVFCCEDCKTNQQNGLCQCEQKRRVAEESELI
ncbi:unnamed protein product [Mucor hiemalis]